MGYTIPSKIVKQNLESQSESTFTLDVIQDNQLTLFLKLSPSQTISIINGAPIEIIITNPFLEPNTITFRLNDIIDTPFWISKIFTNPINQAVPSSIESNLSPIASNLVEVEYIQVALYDWDIYCLYSEKKKLKKPNYTISEWLATANQIDKFYSNHIAQLNSGYRIKIDPLKNLPTHWYININHTHNIAPEPYILTTNKNSKRLLITEYTNSGKHGYFQENSIAIQVYNLFQVHNEFFISPRLKDNTELTDFVICFHDITVLVESKSTSPYIDKPRSIKSVEKALTKLVHKAFLQLSKAYEIVQNNPAQIENPILRSHCQSANLFISICVIDDPYMINSRALISSLSNSNLSSSKIQSYILSFESFVGLIQYSSTRSSFINSLINISSQNIPEDTIPLINFGFK